VAAAMATREALWLRNLLSSLGIDGGAVPTREDSQACLALFNNPEATERTKHVNAAYNMVRNYVSNGDVTFSFLPSAEMPADGLTKALPGPAFKAFRDVAGVWPDLGTAAGALEPDPAF